MIIGALVYTGANYPSSPPKVHPTTLNTWPNALCKKGKVYYHTNFIVALAYISTRVYTKTAKAIQ